MVHWTQENRDSCGYMRRVERGQVTGNEVTTNRSRSFALIKGENGTVMGRANYVECFTTLSCFPVFQKITLGSQGAKAVGKMLNACRK